MRRLLASRIVSGLFILIFGVAVLLEATGIFSFGDLSKSWWTLFIIVPGVAGMASSGFRFWNVFIVFLGVWLLAQDQGWIKDNQWPVFVGAVLVFLGIDIITGGSHHSRRVEGSVRHGSNHSEDQDSFPEYTCVFSTMSYASNSKDFKGGKATSVFAGMTVDLSKVEITSNAVFEIASVFGGLDIMIPKNVPVKVDIVPVFGSFQNHSTGVPPSPGQPTILIKGAAVFGTVKIF